MITIFDKSTTAFIGLGLGTLTPDNCRVNEELNGEFELALSHPYDETEKWKRIENERIIVADTPRGKQPFRIYNVKPEMNSITVNARHIFYDLLDNLCLNINYTGAAQGALDAIKSNMAYNTPFSFATDINLTGTIAVQRVNPINALLSTEDDQQSFIQSFGGELERDWHNAEMKNSIGLDWGTTIAYSKNMTGLEVTEDISNVITRIYTLGKDGITAGFIDSERIGDYANPKIYVMEDTSIETKAELIEAAKAMFASGADLPQVNIAVNFELLENTEEYKDYKILEKISLGDVVSVKNKKMNFSKKAKVISYQYDCLLKKYEEIELGDFLPDIYSSVTKGANSGAVALSASTDVKQIYSLISGIATINSNGLYICVDSSNLETANKIFHFGQSGLRFSTNGLSGAWKTIIDNNGNIQG